MHPDAGAVIGISLAGLVFIVAFLFLCIMHMPCCGNGRKPLLCGNTNRRQGRSSTSSRTTFSNCETPPPQQRQVDQLSARDLFNQNQAPFCNSATGISNPLWRMPTTTCHSCGVMTASQQNLNFAHFHSPNACQFHHPHNLQQVSQFAVADINVHRSTLNNGTDSTSFQYFTPQLYSSAESPPPYPGLQLEASATTSDTAAVNNPAFSTNPPPYDSPKH